MFLIKTYRNHIYVKKTLLINEYPVKTKQKSGEEEFSQFSYINWNKAKANSTHPLASEH